MGKVESIPRKIVTSLNNHRAESAAAATFFGVLISSYLWFAEFDNPFAGRWKAEFYYNKIRLLHIVQECPPHKIYVTNLNLKETRIVRTIPEPPTTDTTLHNWLSRDIQQLDCD